MHTDSTPVTMPTGQEDQGERPQEEEGGSVFAYFQEGVRKALTESPVVCWGNERSFLNDCPNVICFLLLSSLVVERRVQWVLTDDEDGGEKKTHCCLSDNWYSPLSQTDVMIRVIVQKYLWVWCLNMAVIMKHVCDFHQRGGLVACAAIMMCGYQRSAGALNSIVWAKPVFL